MGEVCGEYKNGGGGEEPKDGQANFGGCGANAINCTAGIALDSFFPSGGQEGESDDASEKER